MGPEHPLSGVVAAVDEINSNLFGQCSLKERRRSRALDSGQTPEAVVHEMLVHLGHMLECRPVKQLQQAELRAGMQSLYLSTLPGTLRQLPYSPALACEVARGLAIVLERQLYDDSAGCQLFDTFQWLAEQQCSQAAANPEHDLWEATSEHLLKVADSLANTASLKESPPGAALPLLNPQHHAAVATLRARLQQESTAG